MTRDLVRIHRGQKGITGLETAIILIAFVVVAAVFAYTALSAGLFATQKSQEAVYAGLKEARSTLELRGGVTATANTTGNSGTIRQVSFTVSNVAAGEGIDFTPPTASSSANNGVADNSGTNKVVISYVDKDQQVENLYWTLTKLGNANANNILEQNEKFLITIGSDTASASGGNLANALNPALSVNKTFSIIVKTPVGAVLEIERTTPAYIDQIMNLH